MAKLGVLTAVFCQILVLPSLQGQNNEENPFLDLASSFLQNMGNGGGESGDGLAAIGNMVGSLMQGGGSNNNLGSLLGQMANANGDAGDVLSGIGSLLGGQDGKIDPNLVGSMISMFATQMTAEKPKTQSNRQKRQSEDGNDINLENVLSLASGLLGNKNSGNMLPLVLNAINSFSDPEAKKRADEHKDHASFLPPFVEKLHLYWDLFINSELGKTIWEKSGMKKAMKAFTGPNGNVDFEVMLKNFENHSFRRHWIKAATKYLTDMFINMAKPEVYQRYLVSAEFIINNFLDSRGLPKDTHFNVKKPEESITVILNYVVQHYLNMDTDLSEYVKPAVDYVKETLKMAERTSQSLTTRNDYQALQDRVTDTLNLEVIEPVLRVYRAYRHALLAPHCQEHLMCLVNRHHDSDKQGLPGFKAGLTKFSSLVASAALSFQNGKGFWDLYNAIQNDVNCDAEYPADCTSFHEHEVKITTEIYHTEL